MFSGSEKLTCERKVVLKVSFSFNFISSSFFCSSSFSQHHLKKKENEAALSGNLEEMQRLLRDPNLDANQADHSTRVPSTV